MSTPPEAQPDKTLPAVRQALSHPRDREGLDAGLPVAVENARATGDGHDVEEFARTWCIIACVSRNNLAGRQRFWDTVDDIRRKIEHGGEIPGVPLAEVLASRAAPPQPPKPAGEHH